MVGRRRRGQSASSPDGPGSQRRRGVWTTIQDWFRHLAMKWALRGTMFGTSQERPKERQQAGRQAATTTNKTTTKTATTKTATTKTTKTTAKAANTTTANSTTTRQEPKAGHLTNKSSPPTNKSSPPQTLHKPKKATATRSNPHAVLGVSSRMISSRDVFANHCPTQPRAAAADTAPTTTTATQSTPKPKPQQQPRPRKQASPPVGNNNSSHSSTTRTTETSSVGSRRSRSSHSSHGRKKMVLEEHRPCRQGPYKFPSQAVIRLRSARTNQGPQSQSLPATPTQKTLLDAANLNCASWDDEEEKKSTVVPLQKSNPQL